MNWGKKERFPTKDFYYCDKVITLKVYSGLLIRRLGVLLGSFR